MSKKLFIIGGITLLFGLFAAVVISNFLSIQRNKQQLEQRSNAAPPTAKTTILNQSITDASAGYTMTVTARKQGIAPPKKQAKSYKDYSLVAIKLKVDASKAKVAGPLASYFTLAADAETRGFEADSLKAVKLHPYTPPSAFSKTASASGWIATAIPNDYRGQLRLLYARPKTQIIGKKTTLDAHTAVVDVGKISQ